MANVNTELKALLKECQEDFDITSKSSRQKILDDLQPGQMAPAEGRIYGDDKERFKERSIGRRIRAEELIAKAEEEARARLSEPPSEEALRACQLLQLRPHPSEDEISSLLDRYGDNPMVFSTVRDLAQAKGCPVYFGTHPAEAELEAIQNVRRSLVRVLTPRSSIEDDERLDDGKLAFIGSYIDEAFPVD